MKKKIILLLSFLLLSSCIQSAPIEKGDLEMSAFVASDLHFLSKNLIPESNEKFVKNKITSDGRVQEYDYELVDALIDEVNTYKPNYLFLTGDLTFNGEMESHVGLIEKLDEIQEDTKVLLIPGNHDTYNVNANSYVDDKAVQTKSITPEEFKTMYANYGYSDAYSYDKETLSYIYKLSDDKWALMLDTTLSRFNYIDCYQYISGQLFDDTYTWIEDNLKYADEHGIEVISFSHHNLITVNSLFESRYTLYESNKLLDLYAKYNVKLNFSGHLHVQSIKNIDINGYNVYDIASSSLLDYGNRYGKLDIYEKAYEYNAISLNLFDGFKDYSFNTFYDKFYSKSLTNYSKKYGDLGEAILDFVSKVNCYYFDGDYENIHKLKKSNMNLFENINNDQYALSLFDVENLSQQYKLIAK